METREKFLKAFKHEHQEILNRLIELREAMGNGDVAAARRLVGELDSILGPHFRVEEEALYPMLSPWLGEQNVKNLLEEHRGAVAAVHELKRNVGDPEWLRANGAKVLGYLNGFFMHVTACDGLSIIVERFTDEQKQALGEALDRVWAEALPLTVWRPAPLQAG